MYKVYIIALITLISSFNVFSQWYNQQSNTSDLLYSIQFTDANNGWVTNLNGTKLYHTTNGGADWFVQKDFGTGVIWNFTFLNDSTGYLYSRGSGNLLKSTDGGSNWQLIHSFGPTVEDVKWFDENTGWSIILLLTTSLSKTTNGGIDWQGFDYFNSFDGLLGKVGIINEATVIIPGITFTGSNVIFKTTDGGSNWTEIPISDTLQPGRIQFVNANTGWIDSNFKLYKTSDGGINWQVQGSSIYDFYFINENIGWYISGNQINKTTDGGQTWSPQNSGTNNTLYTINFVDQNNGWVSGDSGTILHTLNGGTPVELTSFTSSQSGNDVALYWNTSTETNNQGFEIQRAEVGNQSAGGGTDWSIVGFVNGKGTTTEKQYYSYNDNDLSVGKYDYRLKQIDFDGTYKYSQTINVIIGLPDKFELSQNYPNPFNPEQQKYSIPNSE